MPYEVKEKNEMEKASICFLKELKRIEKGENAYKDIV